MESTAFYDLLAKKLSGEANSQELSMLEQHLLEHPEDKPGAEAFAQLYLRKADMGQVSVPPVEDAWKRHMERLRASEIEENTLPPVLPLPLWKTGISRAGWIAAASVVLILLAGLGLIWHGKSKDKPGVADEWLTYETGNQRGQLTLQDGTVVWLNKNSRIVYNRNFGKKKRDLTLTGEAYFDVHHDPKLRMLVHARNIDITVKGTAFNVMAYPSDQTVETSLIRGSVQLSTKSDRHMTILLKPNEKIVMPVVDETTRISPLPQTKKSGGMENHEILYSINRLQEEEQSKLIPEIAWIEDRVVFQSESLADVAKKLERFYGIPVEITDPTLAGKRFTGSFYRESLEEALNALQLTCRFSFQITEKNVTIMPSQPATQ